MTFTQRRQSLRASRGTRYEPSMARQALRRVLVAPVLVAVSACAPVGAPEAEAPTATQSDAAPPAAGAGGATATAISPTSNATTPRATTKPTAEQLGQVPQDFGLPLGAALPAVRVRSIDGASVNLESFHTGPVLIIFYRGGWCPYCNFQVRAMTESYQEFEHRGVRVVMISADSPDSASQTTGKFAVPFPLLSDSLLQAHRAFNVVNTLDDELVVKLNEEGRNPEAFSGQTHHSVAVPSVFYFIDGTLRFRHVDPDFRVRPGAEQLLQMVDQQAAAAAPSKATPAQP